MNAVFDAKVIQVCEFVNFKEIQLKTILSQVVAPLLFMIVP